MVDEKNRMQNILLARFILSRLLMLAASIQVTSLNFETGVGTVKFDVRSDTALLAALTGGAA